MLTIKNFFLFLFLALGTLTITAQDCQILETKEIRDEIAKIPGETMGQKLESLLFWTQEEKERRFAMMHELYPSIPVSTGNQISPLERAETITPKWEDKTTLTSYMNDNHVQGVIVLQDNKVRLEEYADGIDQETL